MSILVNGDIWIWYLVPGWVSQLPAGAEGAPYRLSLFLGGLLLKKLTKNGKIIIIILSGNVARKSGGAGLWHVGRLCLACATATAHGASWAENNVDLSRGSLEREKSCLFRRVGGVQRKV